jgi:DNA-binding transcriptional LysR family regulator
LKLVFSLTEKGAFAATAVHLAMTPSAGDMMLKEIESIFAAKLFQRQIQRAPGG